MAHHWRWFCWGMAAALAAVLLGWIFVSYQMPGLLLDLANLRYCG